MKPSLLRRVWGPAGSRLLAGDVLVLMLLAGGVVAASLPHAPAENRAQAHVIVSGEAAAAIDLTQDGTFDVLGPLGVTRLEVRGGRLRVLSSPCPRQVCRHGGWIGASGGLLVCLPNELVVRVAGEPADGPAAISR